MPAHTRSQLSFNAIVRDVHHFWNPTKFEQMIQFVKSKEVQLWGLRKDRHYLKKHVYLTVYKDMKNIGYHALYDRIKGWYKPTDRTLRHNIKTVRAYLAEWGASHVKTGDSKEWKSITKDMGLPDLVKDTNLWMDSSDFKLVGKTTTSKKHESWSYKEKAPAQRFMCVSDGNRRIRYLRGGYSPKVGDSEFLAIQKEDFEENFKDGVIIADCGFEKAAKSLKKVKFHIAYSKNKGKKDGTGIKKLTKKQSEFNKAQRAARARVESPFGIIKGKFKALSGFWAEEIEQQNYLVRYAVGMHNENIRQ